MSLFTCAHCRREFEPEARNRHHQKYCSRKVCRRARDALRRARFRARHADDAQYRRSEVTRVTASRRRAKQSALRASSRLSTERTHAAILGFASQLTGTEDAHRFLAKCVERGLELAGSPSSRSP